ncbi:hypothetical protein [Thalassotalea sp. G2M2-11]|uniref:hypothetical protein n=1 Tax=Thalassotalea sp. G2M2-11 TaxID=2787627 RepID=UPI0019D19BDE|nr:hypothetical protein [Thalassotalea sp. G2M2-11]
MRKILAFIYFACFSINTTSVYVNEHELSVEQVSLFKIQLLESASSTGSSIRSLYLLHPEKIKSDEFVLASIQVKHQGAIIFYANLESQSSDELERSLGSIFGIPSDLNYETTIWLGYGRKKNKLITDYYVLTPNVLSEIKTKAWSEYFTEEGLSTK